MHSRNTIPTKIPGTQCVTGCPSHSRVPRVGVQGVCRGTCGNLPLLNCHENAGKPGKQRYSGSPSPSGLPHFRPFSSTFHREMPTIHLRMVWPCVCVRVRVCVVCSRGSSTPSICAPAKAGFPTSPVLPTATAANGNGNGNPILTMQFSAAPDVRTPPCKRPRRRKKK